MLDHDARALAQRSLSPENCEGRFGQTLLVRRVQEHEIGGSQNRAQRLHAELEIERPNRCLIEQSQIREIPFEDRERGTAPFDEIGVQRTP